MLQPQFCAAGTHHEGGAVQREGGFVADDFSARTIDHAGDSSDAGEDSDPDAWVLWLSRTDEEIPWEKIAGYHYHSGWFWDSVEIQTRGQKANQMGGLPKDQGQRIKEILERMKE